ncbi:MAG: alpha-hydroxy-acid oxidizing protein, partial [Gammaproteobacteria bacterium]|nr:alpha-hydroxy-acid oxidizing protein [Gammaproteobacteria bacterium]
VSSVDTSGTILGHSLKLPVLLAPIGSLQVFDPGGGASAAEAADDSGVMCIASSVCEPGLEEIAASSKAPKIYQLYVRGDDNWVDDIINRVTAAGYCGFCLTVDTAVVSRRERDIAKRTAPTSQQPADGMQFQAGLSWATVERIKKTFDIPLMLKGISHVEDAKKAVDLGVDVIYVSNHGGRQLDQGVGSMKLLPEIVAAVDGRAEIVVDGGFYRGSDIVKAMALGANGVGIGRLEAWALAAGGTPALNRCLTLLKREVSKSLALCGVTSLSELNPDFIRETDVATASDVTSAFPLLNEDYPPLLDQDFPG